MSTQFRDFLKPDAIRISVSASDKKAVIETLVDLLVNSHKLSHRQDILNSVLEREELMSTGVGKGVAIPHGKTDVVQKVLASLVVLHPGVEFGSPDEVPVRVAILLVASSKETGPHIRALAHISRVLQDEHVREQLISGKSAKEILEILERKEKEL